MGARMGAIMGQAARATRTPIDQPSPRRPEACPIEDWLAFLGHRWNALVLWHLQARPLRHHELVAALPGITPKVLAERLEGLERRGLVVREEVAVFPRAVRYGLTSRGAGLVAVLTRLEGWAKGG